MRRIRPVMTTTYEDAAGDAASAAGPATGCAARQQAGDPTPVAAGAPSAQSPSSDKGAAESAKSLDKMAPVHHVDTAAFQAGASPDASGHWPSDYKKAGHPAEIVGGFNTRTGERVPGTEQGAVQELMRLGWDAEFARRNGRR